MRADESPQALPDPVNQRLLESFRKVQGATRNTALFKPLTLPRFNCIEVARTKIALIVKNIDLAVTESMTVSNLGARSYLSVQTEDLVTTVRGKSEG